MNRNNFYSIISARFDNEEEMKNLYFGFYPKNKHEWWYLLYLYWDEILYILLKFTSTKDMCLEDFEAEGDYHRFLLNLKQNRNKKLSLHLQKAWENAPDQVWINGLIGWSVFCDLCSESGALYEKE